MSNANVPMRRDEETRVVKCNEEKPATPSDQKTGELSDGTERCDRVLRLLKKGQSLAWWTSLQRGSTRQNRGLQV
jgi:hypothetical protein